MAGQPGGNLNPSRFVPQLQGGQRALHTDKIHAMANRGLSPHEAAALLYPCETTTYSTWNGGGAASGLRDKAPGARQQLQGDDIGAVAAGVAPRRARRSAAGEMTNSA